MFIKQIRSLKMKYSKRVRKITVWILRDKPTYDSYTILFISITMPSANNPLC